MTASDRRAARLLSGTSILAVILGFAAVPAAAQQAPITLMPRAAEPAAAEAPLAPAGAVISVDTLSAPSVDRIGLMGPDDGGFAPTLWQGSDPDLLKLVLPNVPRKATSVAKRQLARRLLLSPQIPPSPIQETVYAGLAPGAEVDAMSTAVTPGDDMSAWLFETRVAQLAKMGAWADALALIEMTPANHMSDALVKLRADAYLIDGRVDAACTETQAALASSADVHWQKMQTFCQLIAKEANRAALGLALLREQGVEDEAYFWAAELMNGNRPLTPNGLQLTPLTLAMLRQAARPFPDTLIRDGDPTLLHVLAKMPPLVAVEEDERLDEKQKLERQHAAENARIIIAERAVAAGSLDAEDLRGIYMALDLSKDPTPPQLSQVTTDNVRSRAFMFQVASAQTIPTAQAEVIARAIDIARADRGRSGPVLSTVAMVYAPMLSAIAPTPELIWFAGTAARALLAVGDVDGGRSWLDMARSLALTSSEAAGIADSLWPVDHLLTPASQGRIAPQTLLAWQATQTGTEAAKLMQLETVLNLLTAVGDTVTSSDWRPILGERAAVEARTPSAHVWHTLTLSAREGRIGEAAALSLITLGDGDLGDAAALTLYKVIDSLMAAGREDDARALAVDAALAQGL